MTFTFRLHFECQLAWHTPAAVGPSGYRAGEFKRTSCAVPSGGYGINSFRAVAKFQIDAMVLSLGLSDLPWPVRVVLREGENY